MLNQVVTGFDGSDFEIHAHLEVTAAPHCRGIGHDLASAAPESAVWGVTIDVRRTEGLEELLDLVARLESFSVVDELECALGIDRQINPRRAGVDAVHHELGDTFRQAAGLLMDEGLDDGGVDLERAALGAGGRDDKAHGRVRICSRKLLTIPVRPDSAMVIRYLKLGGFGVWRVPLRRRAVARRQCPTGGRRPTARSCFEVHERYPLSHASNGIAPRGSARI